MSQYGTLKQNYPYLLYCLINSILIRSVVISSKGFDVSKCSTPCNRWGRIAESMEKQIQEMAADRIKMLFIKQYGQYG